MSPTNTWQLKSTTINYTFDEAYRLESESRTIEDGAGTVTNWSEAYEYDEVGNRETKTTTVDALSTVTTYYPNARNQIDFHVLNGVTTNYEYDNNGNTLEISDGTITKTMAYDELNRLRTWTDGPSTEENKYRGAQWHRYSYTANGNGTNFLYDGDDVVADMVEDTVNPESYLGSKLYVTPGLDQNVSMTDVSRGDTFYYSQDRRNSVLALTDSTGALATTYEYSAMGETLSIVNSPLSIANRYQYTGRELNVARGEQFFRYRTYSASTGSFFSRDPLGYVDGMSLHQGWYGIKLGVDPFGLACEFILAWGHNKHVQEFLNDYEAPDACSAAAGIACETTGNAMIPQVPDTEGGFIGMGTFSQMDSGNAGMNAPRDKEPNRKTGAAKGFSKLVKQAWKAVVKAGWKQAQDCECDCKSITVEFKCVDPSKRRRIENRYRRASTGTPHMRIKPNSTWNIQGQTVRKYPRCGDSITFNCKKNEGSGNTGGTEEVQLNE